MYTLSKMGDKNFSKAVNEIYLGTAFNIEQYPNYLNWYFTKNIPRVLTNQGEGLFDLDALLLKGLVFIKYDEQKICTLYVSDEYRRNGLGQKMLEESFKLLNTDKPLITIPEYKLDMFMKFIKDYGWKETGYSDKYNKKEVIFNG